MKEPIIPTFVLLSNGHIEERPLEGFIGGANWENNVFYKNLTIKSFSLTSHLGLCFLFKDFGAKDGSLTKKCYLLNI